MKKKTIQIKNIIAVVCKTVEKIDFKRRVQELRTNSGTTSNTEASSSDNTEGSIEERAIIIADQMRKDFRNHDYDIMFYQMQFYFYDRFWLPVDESLFEHCLSVYFNAVGIPYSESQCVSTVHKYLTQIKYSLREFGDRFLSKHMILVNCLNGTVVLDEQGKVELKAHDASDGLFYCLPYDYDPSAERLLFDKFIERVLPDDSSIVLQEFVGTCLNQKIKHEKALACIGIGANGKSVLCSIVRNTLGVENVSGYSTKSLCSEDSRSRYDLQFKLLNFCSDYNGNIANNGFFKQMVSGEPVEARLLFHDAVVIEDYAKIAFNTNSMPQSSDSSKGFARRLLPIFFNQIIQVSEQDPKLAQKINENEAAGVLNWAIEGLLRFIANGYKFSQSDAVDENMKSYEEENDSVIHFLQKTELTPCTSGSPIRYTLQEIHEKYNAVCKKSKFKNTLGRNLFKNRLEACGFKFHKPSNNSAYLIDVQASNARVTVSEKNNDAPSAVAAELTKTN